MKVVLFGNNQTAAVAWSYFRTKYEVVGFTVDREYLHSYNHLGLPVVPFESVEDYFPPEEHLIYVSVAYQGMNRLRQGKLSEAKDKGYRPASFVSPDARVSEFAYLGEHNFVMEGNVIQAFAKIGDNNILWSGNHVGHHTELGDNNFVSSHCVISGSVRVGNNCFFGVNSTVRDNVIIGNEVLVGAGALLTRDANDFEVYKGFRSVPDGRGSREVKI